MISSVKIFESVLDMNQSRTFFNLKKFSHDKKVLLKLEGLNPAGSIKIKPAIKMIEYLEKNNLLSCKKNSIIESSSGNLGVALSIVCKMKNYKFICISDPNINLISKKYIQLFGAHLIIVDKKDINGGFLNTRIQLIQEMLKSDKNLVWLNQYSSENNCKSHFDQTAFEIFSSLEKVDFLFIGVGTSGTLMGCGKYIKDNNLNTKIIAVDAKGSVTFGGSPAKRLIPGIGTSRKPEIIDEKIIDDLILISEKETIRMCREILENYGLMVGGSTGSVLSAIRRYSKKMPNNSVIVGISPDFGDKYINTIFNDDWVNTNYSK